jgi:hypothetical protein
MNKNNNNIWVLQILVKYLMIDNIRHKHKQLQHIIR